VLRVAASVARRTLFVDADVLLLANPWTPLDLDGTHKHYDMLFQAEGGCKSCSTCPGMSQATSFEDTATAVCSERPTQCPMNGGQILVKHQSKIVRRVLKTQPCWRPNQETELALDQYNVDTIREVSGWKTCSLPATYAGHCWFNPTNQGGGWCSLTSYHMQCLMTEKDKQSQMRSVLNIVTAQCGKLEEHRHRHWWD